MTPRRLRRGLEAAEDSKRGDRLIAGQGLCGLRPQQLGDLEDAGFRAERIAELLGTEAAEALARDQAVPALRVS
jgi:hypothetical protein